MIARFFSYLVRLFIQEHAWIFEFKLNEVQYNSIKMVCLSLENRDTEMLLSYLHDMALAFFCIDQLPMIDCKFNCPVYRFLIVVSMKAERGFLPVRDITKIIAELQWGVRMTVYHEFLAEIQGKEPGDILK